LLGVVYSIAVWGAIPWLLQLVPPRGSELFFFAALALDIRKPLWFWSLENHVPNWLFPPLAGIWLANSIILIMYIYIIYIYIYFFAANFGKFSKQLKNSNNLGSSTPFPAHIPS
jgi:hypothetical protein